MSNKRSIQEARAKIVSRIWVCDECGAKIYCGKLTPKTIVKCPCGKGTWQRWEEEPAVHAGK